MVTSPDCFVCRKHRGQEELPGGVIFQDEHVFVSHASLWDGEPDHYLGHLFVETIRHTPGLADLTPQEARAVGLHASRAAQALKAALGMEHVYAFVIGDHMPHLHVHVIGRYPGAPPEYRGPRVDDWPDAPRGGQEEIAAVADKVRDYYAQHFPSPGS